MSENTPPLDPPEAETRPEVERIDPTFRNGSVTAIGVVLAFSLGFLNNWSQLPTAWMPQDLVAVFLIAGGIGFQIWAMAGMLSIGSLKVRNYRRIVRTFLVGLALVAFGVLLAIGGDAFSYALSLLK